MKYKDILIFSFLVFMMFASMLTPAVAITQYETVYVDDSALGANHFDTIPAAIAAVEPDGTVYIGAGTYMLDSTLVIDHDVTIIGSGTSVVTIAGIERNFDLIKVNEANFKISGCTLIEGDVAININMDSNVVSIHDNKIYNNASEGILVNIRDNDSEGFDEADVFEDQVSIHDNSIYYTKGTKIHVYEKNADVNISNNNLFLNHGPGVDLSGTISNVTCKIDSNEFSINQTGINIMDSQDFNVLAEISNNIINFEGGNGINIVDYSSGYYDITYDEFDDRFSIYGNKISGSEQNGIYVDSRIYFQSLIRSDGEEVSQDHFFQYLSIFDNDIYDNELSGTNLDLYLSYDYPILYLDQKREEINGISSLLIAKNKIHGNGIVGIEVFADIHYNTPNIGPEIDGDRYIPSYFLKIGRNEIYENTSGGISLFGINDVGVENNLIAGNYYQKSLDGIGAEGSGILIEECNNISILNNTIIANGCGIAMIECIYHSILDNIVASNLGDGIFVLDIEFMELDGNNLINMAFNDVWNNGTNYSGTADMTGIYYNISEDPIFYGRYDAKLMQGSPCIDSGAGDLIGYLTEDFEGAVRPQGRGIDMGCYEMPVKVWSPIYTQPLATQSLAKANSMWSCIMQNLPSDISPEVEILLEGVQELIGMAGSLANPILVNGNMQQAMSMMEEINTKLGCGC